MQGRNGVSAGARTRTESVGGFYGIQFHHGHRIQFLCLNRGKRVARNIVSITDILQALYYTIFVKTFRRA